MKVRTESGGWCDGGGERGGGEDERERCKRGEGGECAVRPRGRRRVAYTRLQMHVCGIDTDGDRRGGRAEHEEKQDLDEAVWRVDELEQPLAYGEVRPVYLLSAPPLEYRLRRRMISL